MRRVIEAPGFYAEGPLTWRDWLALWRWFVSGTCCFIVSAQIAWWLWKVYT